MEHALTRYRAKHDLSMDALAKLAGTTRQTIHRIESGEQTPSLALVVRLIEATGSAVRADDFLPKSEAA